LYRRGANSDGTPESWSLLHESGDLLVKTADDFYDRGLYSAVAVELRDFSRILSTDELKEELP
jgi:hypothetical protein